MREVVNLMRQVGEGTIDEDKAAKVLAIYLGMDKPANGSRSVSDLSTHLEGVDTHLFNQALAKIAKT